MVAGAEPVLASGSKPGKTVLFVEDEALLRELIAGELRAQGYGVIEAADGIAALEVLRHRVKEIDILFTDVHLPGVVSGWHVAFEFRYAHPLGPVIYATGFDPEPRQVAESVLIRKPYTSSELVALLAYVSGMSASEAAQGSSSVSQ